MAQKIQPMGLAGSREAISAPTAGYASDSTPVSTAKLGPYLTPPTSKGSSSVMKSSKSASAMSTTHTAQSDQANQATVRRLIPPLPSPCSLAPFVTTITLQDSFLPSIRKTLVGFLNGAGTGL